jgi:ferredoxin
MKRKIIEIDEEKCNGCGICIPNCQEGALKVIDGKARLISDLFCDGLGACIGHCPEGAIEIIEREAEPYKIDMGTEKFEKQEAEFSGCPGSMARDFRDEKTTKQNAPAAEAPSELRQWPVQLHLLNPQASYLKDADLVLAADCAAFAMGSFHARYLKGKSLAIACPKLDSNMDSYIQKLTAMITTTKINSLHVIMMEVPCCGGLLQMAKMAREASGRNIPIKKSYLSIQGEVLEEEWS